jgi:hypothetical protein
VARWDDPRRVELRRQVAAMIGRAAEARRVLAALGLDVQDKGRPESSGPAQVVVGPGMGRWNVTIELAAFCERVAPELRPRPTPVVHLRMADGLVACETDDRELVSTREYPSVTCPACREGRP